MKSRKEQYDQDKRKLAELLAGAIKLPEPPRPKSRQVRRAENRALRKAATKAAVNLKSEAVKRGTTFKQILAEASRASNSTQG